VPFDVVIPENERDKKLFDKLKNELSGILNWALERCKQWQENGLSIPNEVRDATDTYRVEMDSIQNFLDQCVVDKDLSVETSARDLYTAYKAWCDDTGERLQSQRMLCMKLADKGFEKVKKRDGIYWIGIRTESDS